MDKLICVGKNYVEHARELGDAVPESPVLFLKPPSVRAQGASLRARLPVGRGAVHHECEIVARLDGSGRIDAVTLGLDMTLRDLQGVLKKSGHPWEVSKVFEGSALMGEWIPVAEFPAWREEEFSFSLDGVVRQRGRATEMRFTPEVCVEYARGCFPLVAGDALFTGTPAGVGPVSPGQVGQLRWGTRGVVCKVEW